MECRSTERRQWIVNKYDVVPVAHIQLLENQTKHSDAGAMIENDYYIFYATDKASGKREMIQCGMGAARDFLRLIGHKGLPLFNPLHGEGGAGGYGGGNIGTKQFSLFLTPGKECRVGHWLLMITACKLQVLCLQHGF